MVFLYQVSFQCYETKLLLTRASLPIGAVTIAVITFILKHPKQEDLSGLTWKQRIKLLDLPGNVIFMALVVCIPKAA